MTKSIRFSVDRLKSINQLIVAAFEVVTHLNHVLDSTMRVLLNDRLDPDEGLHLEQTPQHDTSIWQSAAVHFMGHCRPLVGDVWKYIPGNP